MRRPVYTGSTIALFLQGAISLLWLTSTVQLFAQEKLRVIIETDAGGDPDDEQSLVRFLLYANEWDSEGIIANRPTARPDENHNPVRTGLGIVQQHLSAYGQVYERLKENAPGFPTHPHLWDCTVSGYADSDAGVNRIIAAVDRDDPMQPGWGSWAGRFGIRDAEPRHPNYYWANLRDVWQGTTNRDNTLKRWAADLQNDFRARLDWCVKPFAEANHPPIAALNGDTSKKSLTFAAKPGSKLNLSAAGSTDPDRHALSYQWTVYPEAGTYPKEVRISKENSAETSVSIPADAGTKDIHVILTVRDGGEPPLASYRHAAPAGRKRFE